MYSALVGFLCKKTPINAPPDDGQVKSKICRRLFFNNMILNLMKILRIFG